MDENPFKSLADLFTYPRAPLGCRVQALADALAGWREVAAALRAFAADCADLTTEQQ